VKILIADISSPIEELATLLKGVYVFLNAISRMALMEQMNVVTAAKEAGVKRFVPCGFATVCPAGGVNRVMRLRDQACPLLNHLSITPT
jgi:NmrA-like family